MLLWRFQSMLHEDKVKTTLCSFSSGSLDVSFTVTKYKEELGGSCKEICGLLATIYHLLSILPYQSRDRHSINGNR